jgi:hypothetical protein
MAVCAASLGFDKIVFVSADQYPTNLGGTAPYHAACQAEAAAAGLPGTYKAWISTGATKDNPAATFNQSTVPYVQPDSTLTEVASNWGTFATYTHMNDLQENPHGVAYGQIAVITGTYADGTASPYNCSGWTSNDMSIFYDGGITGLPGDGSSTTDNWSYIGPYAGECGFNEYLYCVQQ